MDLGILRRMRRATVLMLAAVVALFGCGSEPEVSSAAHSTIATGLHVPWGIAFLPGGDALVAERTTGRILRFGPRGGRGRVVKRLHGVATGFGEGGLLGLAVSPNYRSDKLVYAYFTSGHDNRIVRFRLGGAVHPILTGIKRFVFHNGGRIAFGPDGKLYAGVGEAGDKPLAQNRGSLNGKILRMNPDGGVPSGNPFAGSRVWSYGHRNVQGLAWDRHRRLWATEFGQDRLDEVNLIRKGRNYGWPIVEGKGSTRGGRFTNPKLTWRTDDASPSGAAIRGRTLYVGALQCQCVWRGPPLGGGALRCRGGGGPPPRGPRLGKPRRILTGHGRIRTVAKAPDGSLW